MSTHIAADVGAISQRVLLPGDPLRARWIAEQFFTDATCYTEVRGMLGFTGTVRGERVSVQGTGTGMPSLSIYVNELIADYDCRQFVRVGSCGALTEQLQVRDVVIAMAAATDSAINTHRFGGTHFPPTADWALLRAAVEAAEKAGTRHTVGTVVSSDSFYHPRTELTQRLVDYGVLAVEMEAAELLTLAAQHDRAALAVCTVSDHILTGEATSSQEREETFGDMVELALSAMLAVPVR